MSHRPVFLPLAEPFSAPTDRDMLPSERRSFVRTHRTCVFGYGGRHYGPVVHYVPTEDDELLVSSMAARSKARAVARTPKVSLCVLDERWPFTYLQVHADARVDDERNLAVDVMMAVSGRMSGQSLSDDARPFFEAMAAEEQRVVLRCRPYESCAQPPRHGKVNEAVEGIGHWVSARVPWDAPDRPPRPVGPG